MMTLFTQSDLDKINKSYEAYRGGYFTIDELYKIIRDTASNSIELDNKLFQDNM